MLKILVVDDHALVRKGVKLILESNPDFEVICDEAANAQDAARLVAKGDYAMVLLDLSLPGVPGLELLKGLHRAHPKLPILIFSRHPEDQYAVRALTSGAVGYLAKENLSCELVDAFKRVQAGGRYITVSLAERLAAHLGSGTSAGILPHEALSDREFEILRLTGSGRTTAQIAQALFLSVKTVSTYRSRIVQKMNLSSSAELKSYAIKHNMADDHAKPL